MAAASVPAVTAETTAAVPAAISMTATARKCVKVISTKITDNIAE